MATFIFQPAEADANDTYMNEGLPTTKYGTAGVLDMQLGSKTDSHLRSLLAWDLSSLLGYKVVSAEMQLTYNSNPSSAQACYVSRVTQEGWIEGAACWNMYDLSNNWAAAGGDFTTTGQIAFSTHTSNSTVTISGLAALATYALDTSASQLMHMILRATDQAGVLCKFQSSNAFNMAHRPRLTVVAKKQPVLVRTMPAAGRF